MFRTEINIKPSSRKLGLTSPVFSIGSCFSDCMGSRFQAFKFDAISNPFGTVYNPISIFKLLDYSLQKAYPEESSYLDRQGWKSNYDFHSSFSSSDLKTVKNSIRQSIDGSSSFLKKAQWLIITLGTAFVYRRKDNDEIVANCHKVPAGAFDKELLTHQEILTVFAALYKKLMSCNPDVQIIMTVSPVRHLKDTLVQNGVSKAILRVCCDSFASTYPNVSYFPGYEIMMDDLRDYRFYKSDMIHPNADAEQYIWNKFAQTYFDSETLDFLPEWENITKALQHKPFNPESDDHKNFIRETIRRLTGLESKVDVTKELELLHQQLGPR